MNPSLRSRTWRIFHWWFSTGSLRFGGGKTDALYFFTDGIPAYIIDEEVFIQWSSAARPDVPQAFGHSEATPLATYHALMLSWVPFDRVNPATGEVLPDIDEKKVFSAVVVFVHPSQKLSSIEEVVNIFLIISCDPKSVPVTVLCRLPQRSIGEFYPCLMNNAALVLPFSMGPDGPNLHLNMPIGGCNEFAIWHLHWWIHPYGLVVGLPPLYSPDPRLPNVFSLDELPMLWTNTEYLADASNNNVSEVGHPAMTFIHTSCLEVDANSSQVSLTDDDYIQYVTVNDDAKDSTEAKGDEAAEMGEPKVTLKKAKKDKAKGKAKKDSNSSSDGQDDGIFSNDKGQQPPHSVGFQGWSDDEAEGG